MCCVYLHAICTPINLPIQAPQRGMNINFSFYLLSHQRQERELLVIDKETHTPTHTAISAGHWGTTGYMLGVWSDVMKF